MTYLIAALVTAVAIQTAAIVALLVQRSRRRVAERSAEAGTDGSTTLYLAPTQAAGVKRSD